MICFLLLIEQFAHAVNLVLITHHAGVQGDYFIGKQYLRVKKCNTCKRYSSMHI